MTDTDASEKAHNPEQEQALLEEKFSLADAAVQQYELEGGMPGMFDIARAAGVPVSEMYRLFPNKPAIFHFWYESLALRYRYMLASLEGYDELMLSEKLSNMMLSITDMMDERRAFVEATFDEMVFRNQRWHPFCKQNEALIKEIISGHQGTSRAAQIVLWDDAYAFLSKEFLHVIKFWIRDRSENQQKTMALMDNFNGFVAELITNRLIDKGTDLLRFFWNEGIIKVDITLPFIGRIKSGQHRDSSQ